MRWVPIGDIVTVTGGGTPRMSEPSFFDGDIPWVTPKDMKQHTIDRSAIRLSPTGVANSPAKIVDAGSTLVVVRSGVLKHTLPVAIAARPVALNQDMKALSPKREFVTPEYLVRLVKAQESRVLRSVRATTADNFPIDTLLGIEIPLPPLPEQRRIAAILDEADALRMARRRSVSRQGLIDAIYQDMFGSADGRSALLMEVASTASGGTPSRSDPRNFGGGIPWVKSGEVSQGLITQTDETISQLGLATSSARLMPPGTVLVAMYGATAGEVGTLGVEAATNQAVCCITPGRDLDRDFLLESLRTMKTLLKQRAVGGAQPNLSQSDIRGLELKIPPMAQQQEFSRLVQAAREAEHYVSRQAEALDSLFASLQHRAFRGEL